MNTNMYSESFHRVLKIVYLRHKHNRRIYFLIYIARDKAFEQLQKLEKGKHSHRICDINKRHKRAVQYAVLATVDNTEPNLYTVSSESTERFNYKVKRKQLACECKIRCQFCSACAHMYACTCLDACTNTTVCKHLHLVHMHEETKDDDSLKTDTATADLEYYTRVTLPTVTSTSTSRNTLVENIKERITHLLSKCNNCYDINVLKNTYTNLGTVLNNFSSPNNNYSSSIKSTQSIIFKQYNTAKILFHTQKIKLSQFTGKSIKKRNCNDSLHVADNTNRNRCNMF